jgi:hypothetical protein
MTDRTAKIARVLLCAAALAAGLAFGAWLDTVTADQLDAAGDAILRWLGLGLIVTVAADRTLAKNDPDGPLGALPVLLLAVIWPVQAVLILSWLIWAPIGAIARHRRRKATP